MFWLVLALIFFGILLIILESVLPYGISFVIGCGVIALAVWMAWINDPQTGMLVLGLSLLIAPAAAWWVFRYGVKLMTLSPPSDSVSSEPEQADGRPPVGAAVKVVQTLRPTGTVIYQGERFAARTTRPEREIRPGEEAHVRAHDSIYLLVEPKPPETP